MISLIWAEDKNKGIGVNGKLPWNIKEEMEHFRKTTLYSTVVMGRKTYESIGRILPKRKNIIITKNVDYKVEGASIKHSIEEVVKKYRDNELELIVPSISDKSNVEQFFEEFKNEIGRVEPGIPGFGQIIDFTKNSWKFEEWLDIVTRMSNDELVKTIDPSFVPATQFLVYRKNDNKLVGVISYRRKLNTFLRNFGGNIGYSVRPSERGKGYATTMVLLAITWAKKNSINCPIVISCLENNIASEKVILKCGLKYETTNIMENPNDPVHNGKKLKIFIANSYDEIKFNLINLYIIGGKNIYEGFLPYADQLIVSKINEDYHCDTFIDIDYSKFNLVSSIDYGGIFTIKIYQR